jgi:hypothetical protein
MQDISQRAHPPEEGQRPSDGTQTEPKRPFVPPKLAFIEPKLVKQGQLEVVAQNGFFGTFPVGSP